MVSITSRNTLNTHIKTTRNMKFKHYLKNTIIRILQISNIHSHSLKTTALDRTVIHFTVNYQYKNTINKLNHTLK